MRPTACGVAVLLAWFAPDLAASWQEAGRPGAPAESAFRSGVNLVDVYASVTDAMGRPVTTLTQADFEVREDGRLQEVSVFAAGEVPLTVALAVDRSFSMAGEPLRLARQAARSFLHALRPGDRSVVLSIDATAAVLASVAAGRDAQDAALAGLDAWGTTALHDAVLAALDRLEPEPGRQALVVFSDGVDRESRASHAEVVARARRGRALVYPVALGRTRPEWFAELASVTGGRSFHARTAGGLEPALAAVAEDLRHQYLLGYVSNASDRQAGSWRSIAVAVRGGRAGLRVRARDGYVVP